MKPTKPIYSVKKQNGQTVIEGDFDTIQAWLAEGRISSDDDLRREGVHVYEGDELWGRVKDFPEFNLNDREGRQALKRANSRTNLIAIFAGLILLIGISLIVYNQWLPRYSEAKKLDQATAAIDSAKKSEQQAIQRSEELETKVNQKIKELEAAKESSIRESGEKSREEIAKLNDEISKLNESVTLYKNQLNQARAANEKLVSVGVENEQLKSKLSAKSDEVGRLTGANDILKIEMSQLDKHHRVLHYRLGEEPHGR
jgi:hypothetical protein